MSEKQPVSQQVLIPRNGKFEVWDRTDVLNEEGDRKIVSQAEELFEGNMTKVERYAKPEFFDPKIQDHFANELGMSRLSLTAEQLDRHFEAKEGLLDAQKDLGEQALEVIGVESPDAADKSAYVKHLEHLNSAKLEVVAPKDDPEVNKAAALSDLSDCIRDFIARAENGEATYSLENLGGRLDYVDSKLGDPKINIVKLLEYIPRFDGLRSAFEAALKVGSPEDVRKVIDANRVKLPDATANQESQESQEAGSEPQSEKEKIEKALNEAEASIPEKDRVYAWQYAAALHSYEEESALRKMSAETRDNRTFMPYVRLFRQLQEIREKSKK